MNNIEWFIGGMLFGFYIRTFIEVMVVIFNNAWENTKNKNRL